MSDSTTSNNGGAGDGLYGGGGAGGGYSGSGPSPMPNNDLVASADLAPAAGLQPTTVADLAELARLIGAGEEIQVPLIGKTASAAMRRCFEQAAADVERLAQDHLDRALATSQEAKTFAAIVLEAGDRLCARIEQESAKGMRVSEVVRASREFLSGSLPGGDSQDRHNPEEG